ncbi:hypothetical protein DSCA_19020 [Desulfosarcina alkanivorans]|uniref:Uncharacterized protein n=1 Tax=Desulfosarcina alkanivorans TaxID=571177 RepID=A0A5K7YEN0_9BACT|nr:hypothetical protein DSCA_19020 [Desulfosarcina alkanivorans]
MVDPVEKLGQVHVHYLPTPIDNILLCPLDRLMLIAARSEAVTRRGKRWIPDLLKDLPHGLLNQAVQCGGNAQQSDASPCGSVSPFPDIAADLPG